MKFKKSLLQKKNTYIVGVSGGCDSMALLDILYRHNYHIIVCHVNYHVRHDSHQDYQIVSDYCHQRDIPFYSKDIYRYDSSNFEMQARELRYEFYHEIGLQYQTPYVLVAHHYSDLLETAIMQLNRNNTQGYLGIHEVSHVKGMTVIRPLLQCHKLDLRLYCKNQQVPYRDDYTNLDNSYTRNYVRNILLKRYSEQDRHKLYTLIQEHNRIIRKKHTLIKPYLEDYKQKGKISYKDIHPLLLGDVIYELIKTQVYPPLISNGLIDEIKRELINKKPNIEINLPVNALFIKEYDNIYITKKKKPVSYCMKYTELGEDRNEYFSLSFIGQDNEGVYLNEEDFPITIRSFQSGDRIKTSGGHKKVARLFVDHKIPKEQRLVWPIVLNSKEEIILVPHLAKNVKYLYTKPNVFVIRLEKL